MDIFDWPEITKDTPLEEVKRIHQMIWDYAMEHGKKPFTPYRCDCAACEYVKTVVMRSNSYYKECIDVCPIAWHSKSVYLICGAEFINWADNPTKEHAQIVRDIPFKYELEEGER